MKSSLSSLSHYDLTESELGYDFQCALGSTYRVAFSDASKFFLGSSFVNTVLLCDLIRLNKASVNGLIRPDPIIGSTVAYIILKLLESAPQYVIAYFCSENGGRKKQKKRAKRFKEWFEKNKISSVLKIGSYYYESETDGLAHYSGCLFVEDYYEPGEVVGDIKISLMSRGKMVWSC